MFCYAQYGTEDDHTKKDHLQISKRNYSNIKSVFSRASRTASTPSRSSTWKNPGDMPFRR